MPPAQASATDHWLILADAGGLGDNLAARLAETGAAVSIVRRGSAYAESGNSWSVNVVDPAQWSRMFAAVAERRGRPVTAIVGLWSLDETQSEPKPR